MAQFWLFTVTTMCTYACSLVGRVFCFDVKQHAKFFRCHLQTRISLSQIHMMFVPYVTCRWKLQLWRHAVISSMHPVSRNGCMFKIDAHCVHQRLPQRKAMKTRYPLQTPSKVPKLQIQMILFQWIQYQVRKLHLLILLCLQMQTTVQVLWDTTAVKSVLWEHVIIWGKILHFTTVNCCPYVTWKEWSPFWSTWYHWP